MWSSGNAAVLAVADGLGTKARAADASTLAVWIARQETERLDFRGEPAAQLDLLHHAFANTIASFVDRVERKREPDEWRTTLSIAVIIDRNTMLFASIGDSILAFRSPNLPGAPETKDGFCLATFPERTDGSTETLHNGLDTCTLYALRVEPLTGVFLSTDGLEKFVRPREDCDSARFLDNYFAECLARLATGDPAAAELLLWDDEVRSRKGDDIGVAMAVWG